MNNTSFFSLTKDHTSLKSDLQSNELKANALTTENKALKKELENLKIDHDTLVQQKVSNNTRIQNLQRDIEDEKDKGLKNSHLIEVLLPPLVWNGIENFVLINHPLSIVY